MSEPRPVGTVIALYRYPVKSTAGQTLHIAPVGAHGLHHDRRWAVYLSDGGIASGKRTRRFRPLVGLMRWRSAASDGDAAPELVSPAGERFPVDAPAASEALTAAFGQPLVLRSESTVQHHDECPVHLITTSSLAATDALVGAHLDPRRFRPNIIIDTGPEPRFLEDNWTGGQLSLGPEVVLTLGPGMPRCVMVDQDQADVGAQPKALKALGAQHEMLLGLQAHIARPGTVTVGAAVTLHST